MSIIDRYIARQFLLNIAMLFLVLFSFVVAVDASWNIDRFMRVAAQMSKAQEQPDTGLRRALITGLLVADLWWPRLLQLFNFLLGLVMILAMGFTCSQLVRNRELVAILASGQSLFRVFRPVVLVALVMTALMAVNQELLLPRVAPLLTRDQGDAGKRLLGAQSVPLVADAEGRLFYARVFDADRGTIEDLYVWERSTPQAGSGAAAAPGLATRRIYAPRAEWKNGQWVLTDGRADPRLNSAGPAQSTPVASIKTDLDPTALVVRRYAGYAQNLSWRQIGQMLDRLGPDDQNRAERLQRTRWGRISTMAANMLALVIALPFFVTREPRNMVVQSLKAAPVAAVALLGGVLGAAAPIPGVPAAVGVFIPVMILLPVAVAMISSVKT